MTNTDRRPPAFVTSSRSSPNRSCKSRGVETSDAVDGYALGEIESRLRNAARNDVLPDAEGLALALWRHKSNAVTAGKEEEAKRAWCLEQVLGIHVEYRRAFAFMRDGAYSLAWNSLAIIDDTLEWLSIHWNCRSDEFALRFVRRQVTQFRSLFQYGLFVSPEIRVAVKWCSICKGRVEIRRFCGHREGEVYQGELCRHIVQPAEILGVALVDRPRQKLIPPILLADPRFEDGGDAQRHALVRWLVTRLPDAFTDWTCEHTTRPYPHRRFRNVGPNGPCPCGSQRKYKKCCLAKPDGVPMGHTKFRIDSPLEGEPGEMQYLDDTYEPMSLSL